MVEEIKWAQEARSARAHLESDVEQGLRAERVLGYIRDGEISRAMRLLHSQGIAGLTPGVLTQLRAKHPERQHTVPTVLPAMQQHTTSSSTQSHANQQHTAHGSVRDDGGPPLPGCRHQSRRR